MVIVEAVLSIFLLQQGAALDKTQMQFYEAMKLASAEGIPSLIQKLNAITNASPSSAFNPYIHETIQVIGILHPGSVPDRIQRLEQLKTAGKLKPELEGILKRVEILQAYYAAAVEGHPESALEALNDPVFEESPYRLQALADAALRSRNYGIAVRLAMQAIERDPYSPLLANAYMVLGLSSAFRGDAKSALLHFQHALAASALPNIYGDPRNYVFTAYRFARAVPAAVGEIFDEVQCTRLSGVEKLKDPQDLIFGNKGFILLDKEAILTVSPEGKMLDTKPARNVEDIAVASNGKIYSITEERMDPGTGGLLKLSTIEGEKTKKIDNLRSMAVDIRGDVLFLDWDKGLLRGNTADAADSLSLTLVAKIKGRLIRTDSLGNLYILDSDRENILVFSREGVQLTSVSPLPVSGKDQSIEYFALDSLNHLYILTSGSLQIFAMINNNAGLDKKHITVYASEQNPRFRDLKVLGVSATGELVMAGKNDDNWVYFK